jgi:mannose-6-phosphate isomerase
MSTLYPLRFELLFRRYLWGGRRLETTLGKSLPPGDDYAESWEVVDHGDDQSVVVAGAMAGTPLRDIVRDFGNELMGRHHPVKQFPLLFKFLDAHRNLSVQVHPNDLQAARLDPPDFGKTEAWFVLHAEPGSTIYAGLKRGFDRHAFAREVSRGTTELCLHSYQPEVGDCLFIPAGTVHAIGAGLVVAEIQQASDTTFRIFDWNRVGTDGKPRQLHIEQALDVIDFERGPVAVQQPAQTDCPHVRRLVECDKFIANRWEFSGRQVIGGDQRCHLIAVLAGSLDVTGDPLDTPLVSGQTCLLPTACGEVVIQATGRTVLLEIFLP